MPGLLNGGRGNSPRKKNFISCILITIILTKTMVKSSHCNSGLSCPPPESCCGEICCLVYDTREEDSDGPQSAHGPYSPYNYHRLPFWNVWYFWFVVIFLVISCFGGCGYWRRRNLDHLHGHFSSSSSFTDRFQRGLRCDSHNPIMPADGTMTTNLRPLPLMIRRSRSGGESGGGGGGVGQNQASAVDRPLRFLPVGSYLHPPPYSEVTSKPDMYPLVQGGNELKNTAFAYVYATTPFIQSLLPYTPGATMYLPSPAESNSSSLFQSTTTASNYMYPPPYSDGIYAHAAASVSTPGSILSACTPTELSLTTHFLSSMSPPMATTPTSQQFMSEVTTPADSLASPSFVLSRRGSYGEEFTESPHDEYSHPRIQHGSNLLANLVADIQSMTSRMMRSPNEINNHSQNRTFTSRSENTSDEEERTHDVTSTVATSTSSASTSLDQEPQPHSLAVHFGESGGTESPESNSDYGLSFAQSPSWTGGGIETTTGTDMSTSRATLSLPSLSSESRRSSGTRSTDNPHPQTLVRVSQSPHHVTEGTNTSPTIDILR